jgi:hypothetical protein
MQVLNIDRLSAGRQESNITSIGRTADSVAGSGVSSHRGCRGRTACLICMRRKKERDLP